ncbi:MAG: hypothetical protein AB3N14_12465 [Flavobacteriaceae bacterium]
MKILVENQLDFEELRVLLQQKFPNYKVKYPLFSKKMVRVIKGFSNVAIIQKDNEVKITSGLYLGNIWMALGLAVGLAAGLIGGFVFLAIMLLLKKKQFSSMKIEVSNVIKEHYAIENIALHST